MSNGKENEDNGKKIRVKFSEGRSSDWNKVGAQKCGEIKYGKQRSKRKNEMRR